MKVKWGCHGNSRLLEMPRATHRKWSQPKREKYAAGSKAREAEPSKAFDMGPGAIGFGVCLAGLCFGPVFLHYTPTPLFWNGNAYSVPL